MSNMELRLAGSGGQGVIPVRPGGAKNRAHAANNKSEQCKARLPAKVLEELHIENNGA